MNLAEKKRGLHPRFFSVLYFTSLILVVLALVFILVLVIAMVIVVVIVVVAIFIPALAVFSAVAWRVFVVVPIILHKINGLATGIIFVTVFAPFFLVTGRYAHIDRLM